VITYTPEQVARFTQADMDTLVGKTVTLTFGIFDETRTVQEARVGDSPYRRDCRGSINWVGGGGFSFGLDDDVTITVHDGTER
jgi:hypothetical protein